MENIKHYVKAVTNFYGMVHKDKLVEIYSHHNEDKISSTDLELCIACSTQEIEEDGIYLYNDYFVQEAILQFDKFDKMLANKAHKPYYIPNKEELLNYIDVWYIDKSEQYNKVCQYIVSHILPGNVTKAEEVCEGIYRVCQGEFVMQEVFDVFNYEKIMFVDENQATELMNLVSDLSNNMRLWQHNGFTSLEILEELTASTEYSTPEAYACAIE